MKTKTAILAPTILASLALLAAPAYAQLDLPRPSPLAKLSQRVGLTDVSLEYSCPAVKGRKIWGALVPLDQMWRTGANSSTKITFSKDVTFGDKPVPAGTYALLTIPGKASWTVILNKNADSQPGPNYKQDAEILRLQVKPKANAHRERMTFIFSDFTDSTASLDLEWEKLRVSVPLKVNTEEQALASIKTNVDGGWRMYANAARYLSETKKDHEGALRYADTSLTLKEDWFNVWVKASVLAAKGNHKEAYPLAQKASELGMKNEQSFFLAADVKKALADWKAKAK